MKTVIIFLSGAVFGIAALFGGVWLWYSISGWLPYQRPDLQLVTHIEQIAKNRVPFPFGPADMPRRPKDQKYLNLSEYNRWYVEGKDDKGRLVVWGTWRPASEKHPSGIELGHRRFPPDFTFTLDVGCARVLLTYDIKSSALKGLTCDSVL